MIVCKMLSGLLVGKPSVACVVNLEIMYLKGFLPTAEFFSLPEAHWNNYTIAIQQEKMLRMPSYPQPVQPQTGISFPINLFLKFQLG